MEIKKNIIIESTHIELAQNLYIKFKNLEQWFPKWALPPPRGRWRDLGGGKKKGDDWGEVREQGGDRKQ